jgi:outer membrane immunogenic protein
MGRFGWAFADNWSAKFEYQYYDFGSRDVTFFNPNPAPFSAAFGSRVDSVDQHIQTVKFGLNYRFRWQ